MPRRSDPDPNPDPASAPASPGGRSADDTRARLLDAAESLFAARGFEGTSMRALAERAGTGVSAGHYHFGGKLELVRAVLLRRIEPINARRLQRLEVAERRAAPLAPGLEEVLDAFLRPSVEAWRGFGESGGQRTRHILAQLHADPDQRLADLKRELFGPLVERFVDVLARCLSDRGREELALDLQFIVGILVHVVGGQIQARATAASPVVLPVDDEVLLHRMIAFAAAGLRTKTLAGTASIPSGEGAA